MNDKITLTCFYAIFYSLAISRFCIFIVLKFVAFVLDKIKPNIDGYIRHICYNVIDITIKNGNICWIGGFLPKTQALQRDFSG